MSKKNQNKINDSKNKKQSSTKKNQSTDLNKTLSTIRSDKTDSVASMVKKVIENRPFTVIPEWIETYYIPPGTEASLLTPLACLKELTVIGDERALTSHPSGFIGACLTKGAVAFSPLSITASDKNGDKKTYTVERGYINPNDSSDVTIPMAAFSADIISFYTRETKSGIASTIDPKKAKSLNVECPSLLNVRKAFMTEVASVTMSREILFSKINNPKYLSYHVISEILALFPNNRDVVPSLAQFMPKFYDSANIKPALRRKEFYVPKVSTPFKIPTESVDVMWNVILSSNMLRAGDNAGMGALTIGYYYFSMSRSLAKNIARVKEFIMLMKSAGVDTVVTESDLDVFVVLTLIANGYYVVSLHKISLPVMGIIPGEYSTSGNRKNIKFLQLKIAPPQKKDKIIHFPSMNYFNSVKAFAIPKGVIRATKPVFSFCYGYLQPSLEIEFNHKKVSLFPTMLAHNGSVIVTTGSVKGVRYGELVSRAILACCARNVYIYNHLPFFSYDPSATILGAVGPIILPGMKTIQVGDDYEFVHMNAVDIEEAHLELRVDDSLLEIVRDSHQIELQDFSLTEIQDMIKELGEHKDVMTFLGHLYTGETEELGELAIIIENFFDKKGIGMKELIAGQPYEADMLEVIASVDQQNNSDNEDQLNEESDEDLNQENNEPSHEEEEEELVFDFKQVEKKGKF